MWSKYSKIPRLELYRRRRPSLAHSQCLVSQRLPSSRPRASRSARHPRSAHVALHTKHGCWRTFCSGIFPPGPTPNSCRARSREMSRQHAHTTTAMADAITTPIASRPRG